MWLFRVLLQIVGPWQRQFQNGEAAPYFIRSSYHPWIEASVPSVPGLRAQVTANLDWLEAHMQAREAGGGGAGGFIAGGDRYTLPDLMMYTTAEFMGTKGNTAKRTPPFDPREDYGPWMQGWAERMKVVVAELKAR